MKKVNDVKFEVNEFPGNMKHFQLVEFNLEYNPRISSPDDFIFSENFEVRSVYQIVDRGVVQTDLEMEAFDNCPIKIKAHIRALSKLSEKFLKQNKDEEKYHRAMVEMITPSAAILWGELKVLINMMVPKMVTHNMLLPVLYFGSLAKHYIDTYVPSKYKKEKESRKDLIPDWYRHVKSPRLHHFNINGNSVCGKWRINSPEDIMSYKKLGLKCKKCLQILEKK
jgi:hypothetical protein